MAKAVAKTKAAIVAHELELIAAEAARKAARKAEEEAKAEERLARVKWAALEARWEAERKAEVRRVDLVEEWERLSARYEEGFRRVRECSDAAIRQFEQDAGTKAILERIKAIDKEFDSLK